MRVSRLLLAALAAIALAVPAGAEAELTDFDIADIAHDANGINGQGLGNLTGVHPSQPHEQANYAPADFRSIRFATDYTETPVGGDGVDYTATGLKIHITTTATPKSDGPTLIYRINTAVNGCGSFLQSYLRGPASAPTDTPNATLQWRQLNAGCPDGVKTVTNPAWTTTVDAETKTLTMTFPFASLSPAQLEGMGVGAYLGQPHGEVRTQLGTATAPLIDDTPTALDDFVIGSDVPADVACTVDCP
jgi:hypothetical protein